MTISIKNLRSKSQDSISNELIKYPLLFKLIRKLSIFLTWILMHTPLSPNSITISGIISAYFALTFLLLNQIFLSVIFFSYTVLSDFSDGEVSRYKNLKSKEGTYLDKIHHLHSTFIFFSAILMFQYFETGEKIFLFCSFSILPFSILLPFSITYGIDVAEITHLRYLIIGKRYVNYQIKDRREFRSNLKNEISTDKLIKKNKIIIFIFSLTRYWGFPYIFVTYALAYFIDYLSGYYYVGVNKYLTFFYTLTFPILTYIYVWRGLKNKIIEKNFQNKVVKNNSLSN